MQSFPKPEGLITGKEYDVLINQSCGKVFSPQALFLLGASFSSEIKKKRKKKKLRTKKKMSGSDSSQYTLARKSLRRIR